MLKRWGIAVFCVLICAALTLPAAGQWVQPETTGEDAVELSLAPIRQPFDRRFHLPVMQNGLIVNMTLHEYVLGAVLGEMPGSFEPEALKAQAAACRTYVLRSYLHRKHWPAAVCTDPGCCMNWVDPVLYAAQNGAEALEKAEAAVDQTNGGAVCYGGAFIDATFFSCSGGRTEDALAVWGGEVPYLHAVDSPDEHAPHDTDTVRVPKEDFTDRLTQANEMAVFADGADWIGETTRTNGGGVETLELGGCIYTGVQLRRLFGLRSTLFTLELTDTEAVFTTHGYGHRVGMSQYGANAMAKAGAGWKEILQWYYQGTEIVSAE